MTRIDGVVAAFGLVILSSGAGLYSPPAGLIVLGAGMIAFSLWPIRRS